MTKHLYFRWIFTRIRSNTLYFNNSSLRTRKKSSFAYFSSSLRLSARNGSCYGGAVADKDFFSFPGFKTVKNPGELLQSGKIALNKSEDGHDKKKHNRYNGPSPAGKRSNAEHATRGGKKEGHIADHHPAAAAKIDLENIIEQQLREQPQQHQSDLKVIDSRSLKLRRFDEKIKQRHGQQEQEIAKPVTIVGFVRNPEAKNQNGQEINKDSDNRSHQINSLRHPDPPSICIQSSIANFAIKINFYFQANQWESIICTVWSAL